MLAPRVAFANCSAPPHPSPPRPSCQVAKADELSKLHKERRRHQLHLQSGRPERRRKDKVGPGGTARHPADVSLASVCLELGISCSPWLAAR